MHNKCQVASKTWQEPDFFIALLNLCVHMLLLNKYHFKHIIRLHFLTGSVWGMELRCDMVPRHPQRSAGGTGAPPLQRWLRCSNLHRDPLVEDDRIPLVYNGKQPIQKAFQAGWGSEEAIPRCKGFWRLGDKEPAKWSWAGWSRKEGLFAACHLLLRCSSNCFYLLVCSPGIHSNQRRMISRCPGDFDIQIQLRRPQWVESNGFLDWKAMGCWSVWGGSGRTEGARQRRKRGMALPGMRKIFRIESPDWVQDLLSFDRESCLH